MSVAGVSVKAGVTLTPEMEAFLARFVTAARGIPITVTSGVRTASAQAAAMLAKAQRKDGGSSAWSDDLTQLYAKALGPQISQLLASGRSLATWTALIDGWARSGIYLSDHMRGNALDIRTSGLTAEQKSNLRDAALASGASNAVLESDHLHVEIGGGSLQRATQSALTAASSVSWTTWGAVGIVGLLGLWYLYRQK